VVAAHNEAGIIARKLANTWALDYPADRFRILIGSDGSSDGTGERLRSCSDPRLQSRVFGERRGKISVLNDLMKEVDADIVVMSDANTMFAPDAIRQLVRHFRDPRVGCVSGELALEQDGGVSGEGLYWRYEGWIKRNESKLGFLIGCNGGIFAIRPALYEPLPASTVVEDFVLSMRILERGFIVRFEPESRATEPACPTAHAEMVRKTRIGAGGFQALALTYSLLHPRYGLAAFAFWGHKVLRWCVPLFLITAVGANVALLGDPFYRLLLVLQSLGALVAGWAYNARPEGAPPKWVRPISYFYLMNYALLCGFLRFVFRTQRVTWDRASR
jgi:cellulose synthase/poly-beta-1,6-N-acetylglucosamine synthase-like glycosyltransferase